jgi:soluble lytic murein transglycosylase-like protein
MQSGFPRTDTPKMRVDAVRRTILLLAALVISTGVGAIPLGVAEAAEPSPADAPVEIPLGQLAAVRRLYSALDTQFRSARSPARAAAWTELSLVAAAVAGGPDTSVRLLEAAGMPGPPSPDIRIAVTRGIASRDAVAYRLLALGYSARETADVVSGRISRHALDTARRMIMAGRGRESAAGYLDAQYARAAVRKEAERQAPARARGAESGAFDAAIHRYARLHGVEASLVRAVIAVESAFEPGARSPAGAIGLMQLMPATARSLGVNPAIPDQNIEGGVRYLAELLRQFGGVELALIAYNGGPGFARRYARGETALYGETRDYVRRVLGRLPARV